MAYKKFQEVVWDYYKNHKRILPWREGKINPYHVLVSEFMLQQTQVDRVLPKYKVFLKKFPTLKKLASAKQSSVLKEWSGLGYNRRALFLHKTAQIIINNFFGKIPDKKEKLLALPGVGPYIASALLIFIYNKDEICLETNIRTVYIHHFFKNQKKVSDAELLPFIVKSRVPESSREWFYALMDYGSYIKKTIGNFSQKSSQHTRQTTFKGSNRELRGRIIRYMINRKKKEAVSFRSLSVATKNFTKGRTRNVIKNLISEGFLSGNINEFTLS